MRLDAIFANPPGGYWLSELDLLIAQFRGVTPSGRDLDRIIEMLSADACRARQGRVTNWLTLGLLLEPERFVTRAKRAGILRASKYDLNTAPIRGAVQAVLDASESLNLPSTVVYYLASVSQLLKIAEQVTVLRNELVQDLRRSANLALKSLLVSIDRLFGDPLEPNRQGPTDDWHHYTREELAEAVSYCLYLFNKVVGVYSKHFNFLDERGVLEERWMSVLVRAAKIREFLEWEILVDSGLYTVDQESPNRFVLRALDTRTEMAIRLGYITTEMAVLKEVVQTDMEAVDQTDVAKLLHEVLSKHGLIGVVDTPPFRRIVMKLTLAPKLKEILTDVKFFREESAYFRAAMKFYLLGFEELRGRTVAGSATIWDLMMALRLFNLLRLTFRQELDQHASEDPEMVVRSQLPVFRIEELKSFLGLVVAPQACEDVFQLLSWAPTEDTQVVDLQYRPFITSEGYCIVPLNVAGQSNLIRNALYLSRTHPHGGDKQDPIVQVAEHIFQGVGASTAAEITYDFLGQRGEIDVLAYLDGVLFALECKNPFLPVSPFEFRTTLDHIRKGAEQLTRLCELSENREFLAHLAQRSALAITDSVQIVTCIVTGNQMMSGAIIDGHPVRGLFELGGFLSYGGIQVLGKDVRLIEGEKVTVADAVNYLSSDTVHKRLFDSMVPFDRVFNLGGSQVTIESFALSGQKLAETFGIANDV